VLFTVEDLVIPSKETTLCPGDHFVLESCGSWWTPSPERYLCGDYTSKIEENISKNFTLVQFFQMNASSLRVSFHSDSAGTDRGFLMRYNILDRKECMNLGAPAASSINFSDGISRGSLGSEMVCAQVYNDKEGTISSPGYPDPYPPDVECAYTFEKPTQNVCGVRLIVSKFDVEQRDMGTCHDYFAYPGCERVCGKSNERVVMFYEYQPGSNSMILEFVSDFSTQGNGFLMRYDQVTECFQSHQEECPNDQRMLMSDPAECPNTKEGHQCMGNSECMGQKICCWDGCRRDCVHPVEKGGRIRRSVFEQARHLGGDSGLALTGDQPSDWRAAEERSRFKKNMADKYCTRKFKTNLLSSNDVDNVRMFYPN